MISPILPMLFAVAGFFGLSQTDDGRWWVVDPDGKETVILGVDHVTERGHYCEKLGKFPHLEKMQAKFPDKEDWRKQTLERLRTWGFNMLGAGSDEDLKHRGLAHTTFLSVGDSWAMDTPEEFWICPNEHCPCSAFPNVFHPDWEKHCDEVAQAKCAAEKDDPLLFGYFIDNELAWWGRGEEWGTSVTGLYEEALKRPEGHAARVAAESIRAEVGEEKAGETFLRRAAEIYFAMASAAIRKADPNHLVLGARFAGMRGANPLVWEIAGKYCDLVTLNMYPWADLERNVVLNDAYSKHENVRDAFERVYSWVKRPLLVTEWSFPALDSGLPCTYGAGQRFRTQKERTAATELFAKTMLATPFIIGYDYFMWVDEPALGISAAFPENTNYGLTNDEGEVYPEITAMFTRLHRDIGKWRRAGYPEERKAEVRKPKADDLLPDGVRFAPAEVKDNAYQVGDARLTLSGAMWGRRIVDHLTVDGEDFGGFNILIAFKDPSGGTLWCNSWQVVRLVQEENAVLVTGFGGPVESHYEATVRIRVIAESGKALAELVELKPHGESMYEIESVIFQSFAAFAGELPVPREVPTMWKAPVRAVWLANDGRYYGAFTRSDACRAMSFWTDPAGAAHPDAIYNFTDCADVFVMVALGRGGENAWKKVSE